MLNSKFNLLENVFCPFQMSTWYNNYTNHDQNLTRKPSNSKIMFCTKNISHFINTSGKLLKTFTKEPYTVKVKYE